MWIPDCLYCRTVQYEKDNGESMQDLFFLIEFKVRFLLFLNMLK